ncbi:terminase large subunit [Paenibacillus sp. 32352]|uniref:terminase large subunit n=1 Tax=Paenibacillus sp. 32352 TaxID=1969111 RepID=UPI0009ACAF54|nr:terminase TerL endonuclease subunit [Paenibacillus sp. 32352]
MLRQLLIQYSHDVINGEVIACKKHIWACMRFLRDLEREGTDSFPYVFDEDAALRFFEWLNLFRHTKGVLKRQRIEPHEIQLFVFGNIYGWKNMHTGYRRFRKAYWQVGRKNAKSQSLGGVGSYETMAMDEDMSEVYIGATKREQAKIVWNEAEAMLDNCPELQGKYEVKYGAIHHPKSKSFMKTLSKEDRKSGDGYNPQCGIVDEYHAHDTDEIVNVLDSGMIARTQPLLMIITTAGKNLNSPCYKVEYKYVERLLNPDDPAVENEAYFAMVNELDRDEDGNLIDDIANEDTWVKANPIACSYPEGIANIRARFTEAKVKPEVMDDFLTKNMNVWINQKEKAYMRMEKWTACGKNQMPDLRGCECYLGVDLSKKIDLTSISFEFPLFDGRYAVISHSFIPEETLKAKSQTDNVNYDLWVRQKWITPTPGAVVDYRFIKQYVLDKIKQNEWTIKEVCYDPYNATQFAQEMETEGFKVVEIRQGIKTLSEPTADFREKTYSNLIIHENNPVLDWAMGNAVTRQDHNENIMLDKEKSVERIDPATATINAHVRAMVNETAFDLNEHIKGDSFSL